MDLSPDLQVQNNQLLRAIATEMGLLAPEEPPEPTIMADVTTTIGTTGRDYSTIASWEADLDNAGIYNSGDTAIGECYADSNFDESVTINGGGTVGLAARRLTVAVGERHDGTAGTGARLVATGFYTFFLETLVSNTTVEWLELDGNGNRVDKLISAAGAIGSVFVCNNLVHNSGAAQGFGNGVSVGVYGDGDGIGAIHNNAVWGLTKQFSSTVEGFGIRCGLASSYDATEVFQNTVLNVTDSQAQTGYGIYMDAAVANDCRNNVSCGCDTDFVYDQTPTTNTNNASSDTSATGTDKLNSIVTADQFVSVVVGSEDLHLKSGSDCIGAGTDLGTTPVGVNYDIDGRDRDAEGDVWDIGADQFVSAAVAAAYRTLLGVGL